MAEEMPERIWATDEARKWYRCDTGVGDTEYIRTDLAKLLESALRVTEGYLKQLHSDRGLPNFFVIFDEIANALEMCKINKESKDIKHVNITLADREEPY